VIHFWAKIKADVDPLSCHVFRQHVCKAETGLQKAPLKEYHASSFNVNAKCQTSAKNNVIP